MGLDGQKASRAVAAVAQAPGAAVVSRGTIGTRPGALDTLLRPLQSKRKPLGVVSEAGPCGSWLSHSRMHQGDGCWVVAPSLRPHKPGDRVTTDRREAWQRARLRRSGDLTPGAVPARDDDAIRTLSRARAETLRELQQGGQGVLSPLDDLGV